MKWLSAVVLLLVVMPLVCCSSLYAKKALPAEKSIDINTATKDQLMQLPGIGDKRSDKIISKRPYASVDELRTKGAVGEKTLEKLRPYVICGKAPAAAETKAEPEKKAESKEEMPKTQ